MKVGEMTTGDLTPGDARFAIVAARFNGEIVGRLLQASIDTLIKHGVAESSIDIYNVPGAFEIPLTAEHLADTEKYSAIITLGCVIRGDTPHFNFVAGECARGVLDVSLATGVPVIFGVLTTDSPEQANQRSEVNGENKGIDCALCALEMVNTLNQIRAIS